GIQEVIEEKIPKNRQHKVSHSTIVKAMVLNGLGYTERRLYLFPSYFENIPTERLLGKEILPEDINEDTVGRTLDRIYEYGPTKLFTEIALKVMKKLSVEPLLLHLNTTSFSVEGGYEGDDGESAIEITFGYPKDGRWDLKQFILSMATNQYGMPLFEEIHSGNKSDKEIIRQTFKKLKEELRTGIDKVYYIADSSFYTEENIKDVGNDVYWITRVPSTIKMAKDLLKDDLDMVPCEDQRYSIYETKVDYGGIEKRWIVVDSKEMQEKKEVSFNKGLEEDREKVEKELMHLRNREFYCEADAIEEANRWIGKHPWYRFKELKIKEKVRKPERKRGRPKKGEELDKYYVIEGELELVEEEIEKEKEKLCRFIVATNDIDTEVSGEEILNYYKDQKYIEGGFRFLIIQGDK
ncbi:MAG: IS1634 family transposase, partial [bacterium]